MAKGTMLVVPSGVCTRKRYTSGGTSLATVISSNADCFLASGTAAAVENFPLAASSGRSVIWVIFAVMPGRIEDHCFGAGEIAAVEGKGGRASALHAHRPYLSKGWEG